MNMNQIVRQTHRCSQGGGMLLTNI